MLNILVSNHKEYSPIRVKAGPIVLGRNPKIGGLIHTIQDDYCSAQQLQIEEIPGCRVRLTNLSKRVQVVLSRDSFLEPGTTTEALLPLRMGAGKTVIEIEQAPDEDGPPEPFATIAQPIALRVRSPQALEQSGAAAEMTAALSKGEWPSASLTDLSDVPGVDRLMRWFETVVTVQRSAASSDAFFQDAARAVVDLIGLDCGLILSLKGDEWTREAGYPAEALPTISFSPPVLEKLRRDRRTLFRNLKDEEATTSLSGVSTLVASPIFGNEGAVVGAVYGVKFMKPHGNRVEIRPLEAQLVQVLAAAVGAGLARRESELEAARRIVQFEQFFSQELARELDRDRSLLDGREREVTILVSDIRGFSRIAEQLGPRETCLLINDVLERLTYQIHEHGGIVVDYVGDGLMAMWNAPVPQPDHCARACEAALAMQAELPSLNERWQKTITTTLGLGIGINTGTALVGNTGCPRKFKYGPLGHTVNLASRVEGATKQLCVPILITGSTREQLAGTFATRRLCRACVVGIEGTVDLHELHAAVIEPEWEYRRDLYEKALTLYESSAWTEACKTLSPMLAGQEGHYDLPTLSLIGRAIECLKSNPTTFDPVLHLLNK